MTYAKPSTPFVLTILFLFAITAFDSFVVSKENLNVIKISTENIIEADSIQSEIHQPTSTYFSSLQQVAP